MHTNDESDIHGPNTCPICYEQYSTQHLPVCLNSGVMVCMICCTEIMRRDGKCPLTRIPLLCMQTPMPCIYVLNTLGISMQNVPRNLPVIQNIPMRNSASDSNLQTADDHQHQQIQQRLHQLLDACAARQTNMLAYYRQAAYLLLWGTSHVPDVNHVIRVHVRNLHIRSSHENTASSQRDLDVVGIEFADRAVYVQLVSRAVAFSTISLVTRWNTSVFGVDLQRKVVASNDVLSKLPLRAHELTHRLVRLQMPLLCSTPSGHMNLLISTLNSVGRGNTNSTSGRGAVEGDISLASDPPRALDQRSQVQVAALASIHNVASLFSYAFSVYLTCPSFCDNSAHYGPEINQNNMRGLLQRTLTVSLFVVAHGLATATDAQGVGTHYGQGMVTDGSLYTSIYATYGSFVTFKILLRALFASVCIPIYIHWHTGSVDACASKPADIISGPYGSTMQAIFMILTSYQAIMKLCTGQASILPKRLIVYTAVSLLVSGFIDFDVLFAAACQLFYVYTFWFKTLSAYIFTLINDVFISVTVAVLHVSSAAHTEHSRREMVSRNVRQGTHV